LTKCPNCNQALDSHITDTGNVLQHVPDKKIPKKPRLDRNIPLAASVLFDAKTKRFIVADTEHPDEGFMEMRRTRKRFFPKMKDLPRTNDDLHSKEFKQVTKPDCTDRKKRVDDISKSCTDLAIDG
jgi:ssDNA-binding Zn-finger/Zn-ribbon topoisomerase 1